MGKKVVNVLFKLDLEGNGIVNYDSNNQKNMFYGTNLKHMYSNHKNVNYAKKNFYRDLDNNLSYKIKLSSNLLRKAIFDKDVFSHSSNIVHHPFLLNSFIASPASLLRGYVELQKNGDSYKRKSALCISGAEQTNDAVSYIETCTKTGEKNTDPNQKDITYHQKETIGEITYSAKGHIDLNQLQFVSCDQVFDRYAFNPDTFKIYKQFLQKSLPSFDSELGYYEIDGTSVKLPEYGVKLNNESVVELVKLALVKILEINISRANASANTSKLQYKLVYDVLEDTFDSEEGWVTVSSREDVSNLDFEVKDFYNEKPLEEVKSLKDEMLVKIKALKTLKAEEAKAKKLAKAKATEKAKNKKDTKTT